MQTSRRRGISIIPFRLVNSRRFSRCRALLVRSVSLLTAIAVSGISRASDATVKIETKQISTKGSIDTLPDDISIELFGRVPRQRITLREAIEMALANNL